MLFCQPNKSTTRPGSSLNLHAHAIFRRSCAPCLQKTWFGLLTWPSTYTATHSEADVPPRATVPGNAPAIEQKKVLHDPDVANSRIAAMWIFFQGFNTALRIVQVEHGSSKSNGAACVTKARPTSFRQGPFPNTNATQPAQTLFTHGTIH